MHGYSKYFKSSHGFTLIEILIAMAIGLVILGALYGVFTMQNKTLSNQEQIVEMQQNARAAMDLLTREISMAGYNPKNISDTTSPRISAETANSISFVVDLNGDGDTADSNENITYDIYTSNGVKCLGRTTSGSKQPAVEHIENMNLTYLLSDGTETTTPNSTQLESIVKVRVSVTAVSAKPDSNTGNYMTYTLTSEIVPRNLALSGANLAFSTPSSSGSGGSEGGESGSDNGGSTDGGESGSDGGGATDDGGSEGGESGVDDGGSTDDGGSGSDTGSLTDPTIANISPVSGGAVTKGTTVSFCADITHPSGVDHVTLWVGEDSATNDIATTGSGDRYCGSFKVPSGKGKIVIFKFVTVDDTGASHTSSEYSVTTN